MYSELFWQYYWEILTTLPVKQLWKKNRTEVSQAEHWFSACTLWSRFYLLCSPQMHINLQLLFEILLKPRGLKPHRWRLIGQPLCRAASASLPGRGLDLSPSNCQSALMPSLLQSFFPQRPNPAAWESGTRGSQRRRDGGWTLAYCWTWQLFSVKPLRTGILINDHWLKDITSLLSDQNCTCKQSLSLLCHLFEIWPKYKVSIIIRRLSLFQLLFLVLQTGGGAHLTVYLRLSYVWANTVFPSLMTKLENMLHMTCVISNTKSDASHCSTSTEDHTRQQNAMFWVFSPWTLLATHKMQRVSFLL